MIGDGVNDGPAFKAAYIGVAMGEKGSEIAKAAASIVLTNDDLGKLVIAIRGGKKNLYQHRKAVQYYYFHSYSYYSAGFVVLFLGLDLSADFYARSRYFFRTEYGSDLFNRL